jgi:formamidopyrimidine-DNA glycosylase
MKNKRRCNRCGGFVRKETVKGLRKEYPFYCPTCDENMYRFETYKAKKKR